METPKIIWQTWKTKNISEISDEFQKHIRQWKEFHPDYKYILLDDNDLRNIIIDAVPQYLKLYDSFTENIERVDFARYALLYKYGGIYADLDTIPLKSLDLWIEKNNIVLGCEPKNHAINLYDKKLVICNAVMISPPNENFWKKLMSYIASHYEYNYRPVENTGPLAVTNFWDTIPKKMKEKVVLTDPCIFFPLEANNSISKECNIKNSYVVHVWKNTWVKPWYKDKLWYNRRYWAYFLLILFVFLCVIKVLQKK